MTLNKRPINNLKIDWEHPLSKDLIGAYTFRTGSSRLCYDLASGEHGTLSHNDPASSLSIGQHERALDFSAASNQHIQISPSTYPERLAVSSEITISAWLYLRSGSDRNAQIFGCLSRPDQETGYGLTVWDNNLYFRNKNTTWYSTNFNYGEWFHLTLAYYLWSSQTENQLFVTMWVNGTDLGTNRFTDFNGYNLENADKGTYIFGRPNSDTSSLSGSDLFIDGKLENLFVWERALNSKNNNNVRRIPAESYRLYSEPYILFQDNETAHILSALKANTTDIASGGAKIGGFASLPSEYDETGSGGIETSGSFFNAWDISSSGGLKSSGVSPKGKTFVESGSGGMSSGGNTEVDETESSRSGVITGATAGITSAETRFSSGGSVLDGSALVTHETIYLPTGGVRTGSVALTYISNLILAVGGVETSGSTATSISNLVGGGIHASGATEVTFKVNHQSSGGLKTQGSLTISNVYHVFTAGGSNLSGAATVVIEILIGGGATVKGKLSHQLIFANSMTGGLVSSATSKTKFTDFIISKGGVVSSASSRIEKLRFFQSFRKGYGRAMCSSNILNAIEQKEGLIKPTDETQPIMDKDRYRVDHYPTWCETKGKCDAIVSKVIKQRQVGHMPPKIRTAESIKKSEEVDCQAERHIKSL